MNLIYLHLSGQHSFFLSQSTWFLFSVPRKVNLTAANLALLQSDQKSAGLVP